VHSPLLDQRYFYLYFLGELWFAHSRQQVHVKDLAKCRPHACIVMQLCFGARDVHKQTCVCGGGGLLLAVASHVQSIEFHTVKEPS
jgi:hypothetical protein